MTDKKHISFDGWTLNPRSGELWRDGKTIRLPPQPLAMLLELLAQAGEVVTRERLVQVLWPNGVVDFDSGLNAVVRKLRVTLGDDREAPRYIETLPRIGYRFLVHPAEPKVDPTGAPTPASIAKPRSTYRAAITALTLLLLLAAGFLSWQPWTPSTMPAPTASATSMPRRSTNERAYDLYLEGISHRSRRDMDGTALALAAFKNALAEDPLYAEAWAAMAETLAGSAMIGAAPPVETYEQARNAALRAIEIDDGLSHGHAALAHIHLHYDRDFARAEAEVERARALDPHYGRNWHTLGILRAWQERIPEALDAMRRARELEPTAPLQAQNYGQLLYQTRRSDEAIRHLQRLIASQPPNDQARSLLVRSLVAQNDAAAALGHLHQRVADRFSPSDAGLVYAHLGRRADALSEIDKLERLGAEGYGVGYDIAIIHAALGDTDAGCAALERALVDHSLLLPWMRLDPRMDPLRQEPCFDFIARQLYGDDFARNQPKH